MRLIDADKAKFFIADVLDTFKVPVGDKMGDRLLKTIDALPTVDAAVLPCKPGDTVFVLWRLADPDICSKCPDFHWGGMGDSHECGKTEDGFRSAECIEIQEWTANRDRILSWIGFDEFGKTVFLTREEAEKALAKRRNEHEA